MAAQHFRFLHSSDFHLEQPVHGLTEVPDHLRELMIDAPYKAAERVFETAVAEEVEFVILAGDICDLRTAGPKAFEFVRQQLERLNERRIGVYWSGGRVDRPDDWPQSISIPSGTNVFPRARVTEITHVRDGQPLAHILGTSGGEDRRIRGDQFRAEADGLFCLAIAHGPTDTASLRKPDINYWALGAKHGRTTLFNSPSIAHYCGSPQGRTPHEDGPHGCTLVTVDERGRPRTRMVSTDSVRWHNEQFELAAGMSHEDLAHELNDRTRHLTETALGRQLLVSWSIVADDQFSGSPTGQLAAELRHGSMRNELLDGLRTRFGQETPGVWTVDIELTPPAELPEEWYEEDTILGEMLRCVRRYQNDQDLALDFESYLPESHKSSEIAAAVRIADAPARQRLLRQVAVLGVDLLRGQQVSE